MESLTRVLNPAEFMDATRSTDLVLTPHEWNYKAATVIMAMAMFAESYTAEDFGKVLQQLAMVAPSEVVESATLGMIQVNTMREGEN